MVPKVVEDGCGPCRGVARTQPSHQVSPGPSRRDRRPPAGRVHSSSPWRERTSWRVDPDLVGIRGQAGPDGRCLGDRQLPGDPGQNIDPGRHHRLIPGQEPLDIDLRHRLLPQIGQGDLFVQSLGVRSDHGCSLVPRGLRPAMPGDRRRCTRDTIGWSDAASRDDASPRPGRRGCRGSPWGGDRRPQGLRSPSSRSACPSGSARPPQAQRQARPGTWPGPRIAPRRGRDGESSQTTMEPALHHSTAAQDRHRSIGVLAQPIRIRGPVGHPGLRGLPPRMPHAATSRQSLGAR